MQPSQIVLNDTSSSITSVEQASGVLHVADSERRVIPAGFYKKVYQKLLKEKMLADLTKLWESICRTEAQLLPHAYHDIKLENVFAVQSEKDDLSKYLMQGIDFGKS